MVKIEISDEAKEDFVKEILTRIKCKIENKKSLDDLNKILGIEFKKLILAVTKKVDQRRA